MLIFQWLKNLLEKLTQFFRVAPIIVPSFLLTPSHGETAFKISHDLHKKVEQNWTNITKTGNTHWNFDKFVTRLLPVYRLGNFWGKITLFSFI